MPGEVVNLSPYAPWSRVIGLVAIGHFWIIYGKIADDFRLKKFVEGADGSSSKLQWTL